MNVLETKSILKFRRNGETWICPECDVENNITSEFCNVCGCPKTAATEFLKSYSKSDETPVMTEKNTSSSVNFSPAFKDDVYTDEEVSSGKKSTALKILLILLILVVIAIIVVVSIFAINKHNKQTKYEKAVEQFNSGNYEEAIRLFEELPSDYKDVENMILESTYQQAVQLMNNSEYESARNIFKDLGDFKDSSVMINECTYLEACDYLDYGEYEKARTMFEELYDYGNSQEMVLECDYCIAQDYMDEGDYIEAMKAFNDLGSYRNSYDKFSSAESMLADENYYAGTFKNDFSNFGKWSDSSGNYIQYVDNYDGTTHTYYNLPYTYGEFYKMENGIHYHGSNYDGWEKQWIIQLTGDYSIKVYNYIDEEIYYLSK